MNPDLLVNVIVPQPRAWGIDFVAVVLGNPLSVILADGFEGVLVEPPYELNDPTSGATHDVFSLCIPDKANAVIPLGKYGCVVVGNEGGALLLCVPATVRNVAESALKPLLQRGSARYLGTRKSPVSDGSLAAYLVTPDRGAEWSLSFFGLKLGFIFP